MAAPLKVGVIGAGVAGLTTARELQKEGHRVVVYEKADKLGGTWVYNPKDETDPLGLDPRREIVHSSLYYSLRTNLPRRLMRFFDYPFTKSKNGDHVTYFPRHEKVLEFLNDFARKFELNELIRFNTEVVLVEQVNSNDDQWVVESRTSEQVNSEELFDAVVICSGHNTQPRLAELPGIKKWPGKQIHSHNYRQPEPFQDQIVIVIGFGPSAMDVALEISNVAEEVHVSTRFPLIEASKVEKNDNLWEQSFSQNLNARNIQNLWQHSQISFCYENGEVAFEDGSTVAADVIIHCTGTNGTVTIDDNRVGPLYKHVFPPQLAPRLSFVGIPKQAINFLMIDLQAKWVAHVLSGKAQLPSKEEMLASVEEYYRLLAKNGIPKHHTHTLPFNCEYLDWLAGEIGLPPVDEGIKEIYENLPRIGVRSWTRYRENAETWMKERGF